MVAVAMSLSASPAMAAVASVAGRNVEPCSCRSSAACASSFLSSEVHSSALSPVFQTGRVLPQRLAIRPRRSSGGAQNLVVRGLFGLGVPELAVIAGVAAILFGPKKLPEIGKSLGKTVKSFQQAAKEFESEIKSAQGEASEGEATSSEKPAATPGSTPSSNAATDKEVV